MTESIHIFTLLKTVILEKYKMVRESPKGYLKNNKNEIVVSIIFTDTKLIIQ